MDPEDLRFFITVYALFGLAVVFVSDLHTVMFLIGSFVASRKLHKQLLSTILGAPLRFFEVTPLGRVLNRFSKDLSSIDEWVVVVEADYRLFRKI